METLCTGVMSNKATSLDTEPPRKYYYSIVLQMTFNSVIFGRSEKCWDLSPVRSAIFRRWKKFWPIRITTIWNITTSFTSKQINCCSWIASVKVNACANLKHNRMLEGIYWFPQGVKEQSGTSSPQGKSVLI